MILMTLSYEWLFMSLVVSSYKTDYSLQILIDQTYNNLQQEMILEISNQKPKQITQKLTWKEAFKQSIYKRNIQSIRKCQMSQNSTAEQHKRHAQRVLVDLFHSNEEITVKDTAQTNSCHSYYSTYIPLKMQSRFDDELTCTFPYLRSLNQKLRINDRTLLLIQISQSMKECKEKGTIDMGWYKILKKYICGLDSVRACQIYLELKKIGTSKINQLHIKYGNGCLPQIFFERVCSSARYFKRQEKTISQNIPLSLQTNQEINQVTMPKTMKQLFCCICLIYDCTQHAIDDNLKQKHYQYISPKNKKDDQQNLRNAIIIIQGYKQLISTGKIQIPEHCSSKCYKTLTTLEWSRIQGLRSKVLVPMVNGIIKLGIQIYSYSPCDIWDLLKQESNQNSPTMISCSLVFLFFIEEYNLLGRLEKKLFATQAQMLSREIQMESRRLPDPPKKKKRVIKIAHTEHYSHISSCCHFFLGEQPFDVNCDVCACRQRGFCIPQCLCEESCPIRKKGCNCKKQNCQTKKCICYANKEECDPEICLNCYCEGSKKNSCRNNQIINNQFKKVKVGRSTIQGAGLGLFAFQNIKKDDLVMIYSGELIDQSIDLLREVLSVDSTFYNFGSPEGTIDARFMGNLSRFINHGDHGRQNLRSENKLTEGRFKIGFYAQRDIQMGQQLFFDYDGEGQLYKNFRQKYPFINSKNSRGKNKINIQ